MRPVSAPSASLAFQRRPALTPRLALRQYIARQDRQTSEQ